MYNLCIVHCVLFILFIHLHLLLLLHICVDSVRKFDKKMFEYFIFFRKQIHT